MKRTVVRPSPIHGKGLFACRDFRKGEIVERHEGEIVLRESRSKYAMVLSGRRTLLLTGKTKWVNHASDCNVRFTAHSLIAERDIAAGEELVSRYDSVF